ncbi:MAG: hypothetical protein CMO41_04810 [Verrucomicrobiales bacterium]|nr:hypothetical protein [Verrucomicrobiales bacterium]|tara:strand:- start:1380 stop:2261 length:882 start_codon:yes stop_codon:yes gene_type:complete
MKKALAQNPNLLRTLIGLSLTLIFMLSYAVYGATVSPSVYIYKTEPTVNEYTASSADEEVERTYDAEDNTTTWAWQVIANDANLTWVNVTATELSSGALLRVTNVAMLYSHELLGSTYTLENPLEEEFSCADLCDHAQVHERISEDGGTLEFHALTSVDPARRSNGSVFAADLAEAESKARAAIEYTHSPSILRIEIVESGNRTTEPSISAETVNEEFASIAVFSVDATTEFLWALAAVVGCFSMVLIPSFTVYFAARAKEKRDEAKLELAKNEVESYINDSESPSETDTAPK